jgi:NAD-dependent deacetylase
MFRYGGPAPPGSEWAFTRKGTTLTDPTDATGSPGSPRIRIAVFSGAGISAESGVPTFRDDETGLWSKYDPYEISSTDGWQRHPERVWAWYLWRHHLVKEVQPNDGHRAVAMWQDFADVTVITQNVDDLHERAGSVQVLHLHGELTKARSMRDPAHIVGIGYAPVALGDRCPRGGQLRPHIVWFGEAVEAMPEAEAIIADADMVVVIGTSLQVYPAAGLTACAPVAARCYLVDPNPSNAPPRYEVIAASAEIGVPALARQLGLPTG